MEKRLALFLGTLFLLGTFLVYPVQVQSQTAATVETTGTTGPIMLFVDDNQGVTGESIQTTRYSDHLNARWGAEDNDSRIKRYKWSIQSESRTIKNGTTESDGILADGLSLENGKEYFFRVSAQNNAGQWSGIMSSRGVLVNVGPYADGDCDAGTKNGDETDIDCGGSCPKKCDDGEYCRTAVDCKTDVCSRNVCFTPSCEGDDCTAGNDPDNDLDNDLDGDGISDDIDNCPGEYNPGQDDHDLDKLGNECDDDDDDDKMPDNWENEYELDPLDPDDADSDDDGDGLTNLQEYAEKTNPGLADSDGDGHEDAKEISKGTDPADPDSKPGSRILTIFAWLLALAVVFGVSAFILREKLPPPMQEFMEKNVTEPIRRIMNKRSAPPMHKTVKQPAPRMPVNPVPPVQAPGAAGKQSGIPHFSKNILHSRRIKRTVDSLMDDYGKISGEQVFKKLRKHTQKIFSNQKKPDADNQSKQHVPEKHPKHDPDNRS